MMLWRHDMIAADLLAHPGSNQKFLQTTHFYYR